jgi:bifunctional DNA-binding transcriptional regulator/antitoxin component of YhaV-PrlF toxin-antitoxin module
MSLQSTVGIARTGAKSLRATIPEGMVAFLELTEGDKLEWKMDIRDGERIAIVRRAKPTDQA